MKVLGRIFLNSRNDRRKDGVFLWDLEELTFLINHNTYRLKSNLKPFKLVSLALPYIL